MKILYDHQIFASQQYGGISRYFYEIITRMVEKNQNAIDLFQGYHVNKYGMDQYENKYNRNFSRKRKIIPHTGRIFEKINKYMFEYFSGNENYDIYHPTYYESLLQSKKTKIVITVYDMIHELFKNEFLKDKTALKKEKIINRADGIIAISESTKHDLINILGINEEIIKVIYLANSLIDSITTERMIDIPYILYVGNRSGYKNFNVLAKAFALLRLKKHLRIVCFGGQSFSRDEIKLLNQLGIQDYVNQYSGDDTVLANLYHYAEVFVYPSQYEGFGIPPLEAMHYGTPVIVSAASSIPEIVGDAGLYFDPNAEEELANKIELLLHDHVLKKKLISLGFEREKKFSWEKCADETMSYYMEVCTR